MSSALAYRRGSLSASSGEVSESELSRRPLPRHAAIIMDGNGRWAEERGLPRVAGHRQGFEAARRVASRAAERGLECLTLFCFSSENWSRPHDEVEFLMEQMRRFVDQCADELDSLKCRVRVLGDREGLDDDVRNRLSSLESRTSANCGMTLGIAFNYGGRQELTRAAKSLMGELLSATDEERLARLSSLMPEDIERHLDTSDLPRLDLVIRTSGERRLSNFLLWQAAYAELIFVDVFWPDFDAIDFDSALVEFSRRRRRFGAVTPRSPSSS